jgi:polysaccharide export outer membrane protein
MTTRLRHTRRRRGRGASRLWVFGFLWLGVGLVLGAAQTVPQDTKALPANDYRIGANDLLEITVFELPELNQTVRVSEDGSVSLMMLGKVAVTGLTAQELEKKLAEILEGKYLKAAHVTVFIKEFQRVSILGAVAKPGMYELVGPTNLLQVISQAGGLTAEAMTELYIYRGEGSDGKETLRVDLNRLIQGDQSLNVELRPKDVIMVPIDRVLTVFVYGQVKTPGAIQFKQSRRITLLQALSQAGGPTEWAKSSIVINRNDPKSGKPLKIPVNLKDIISGKTTDVLLEEGDVVIVP